MTRDEIMLDDLMHLVKSCFTWNATVLIGSGYIVVMEMKSVRATLHGSVETVLVTLATDKFYTESFVMNGRVVM